MIYSNILELVGNTPMIELKKIEEKYQIKHNLYAKIELFNPSGSIKVRPALQMIEDAIKNDLIQSDTVIIEATSGNTGIALAMVCAIKQLHFICVMPESMSKERIQLIKAYGAEIVLTNKEFGMEGSVLKVEEIAQNYSHVFIPSQFTNQSNVRAHYLTTGQEILNDLPEIDYLFSGIGTGGTITGVSEFIKEKKEIITIGVEPETSPLISKGYSGKHPIQGIGANFIPDILKRELIDEVITVSGEEAYYFSRELAKVEGIFVGISSGACLAAAIKYIKRIDGKNKNIVIIFPDTGERYLSTGLVEEKE